MMRVLSTLLVGANLLASVSAACAQEVDDAFGRKAATIAGDVHRYGFPRTDLNMTLDGVTIRPALALGGWVAFKSMGRLLRYFLRLGLLGFGGPVALVGQMERTSCRVEGTQRGAA